ncbi:hypothetical protein MCOR25_009286 [Pyricularia grisea]|nr:hypothetical protein MCOR25_009286 [Pyricularia grisea]
MSVANYIRNYHLKKDDLLEYLEKKLFPGYTFEITQQYNSSVYHVLLPRQLNEDEIEHIRTKVAEQPPDEDT